MDKKLTIFLDIDGCLNSLSYLKMIQDKDFAKLNSGSEQPWHEDVCKYIDPFNVIKLNTLADALIGAGRDPEIIIHSSWRFYYTLNELRDTLLRAGLNIFKCYRNYLVTDVTPISIKDRGESIRWYLEHHKIDTNKYIIIEDLELGPDLAPRQIKTDWQGNGFDDENLKEAFKLVGINS